MKMWKPLPDPLGILGAGFAEPNHGLCLTQMQAVILPFHPAPKEHRFSLCGLRRKLSYNCSSLIT